MPAMHEGRALVKLHDQVAVGKLRWCAAWVYSLMSLLVVMHI